MIFDIHTIEYPDRGMGTTYQLVLNNETIFIVATIIIDILISFVVSYLGNYNSERKTLTIGIIFYAMLVCSSYLSLFLILTGNYFFVLSDYARMMVGLQFFIGNIPTLFGLILYYIYSRRKNYAMK